ncbi:MAG: hypothetical protein NTU98_07825 [Bacteroidetes bacterium]|nr:hypothetical protein [Bacteroidota bacterium]
MKYEISVSEDKSFILINVDGDFNDNEEMMMENIKAHQIAQEFGIEKFLMDLTKTKSNLSPLDRYDFAYNDLRKNEEINMKAKIAMIVSEDDHSHDFSETVLQNAGVIAKIFRNRDEAIAYLKL